jgi:hypothetical protein
MEGEYGLSYSPFLKERGIIMITVKNRRMIVPPEERFLGVETDTNSSIRVFRIPRYITNEIDLSSLAFFLDIRYEDNTTNETAFIDMLVSDNSIDLTWYIAANDLGSEGAIFLQLKANDLSGKVKWKSFIEPFFVGDCIDAAGQYTGDLSVYEALVTRCVIIENREVARMAAEELRQTNTTNAINNANAAAQGALSAAIAAHSAKDGALSATEDAENKIIDIETRFNTLTAEHQQDSEVIDARKGKGSLRLKIVDIEAQLVDVINVVDLIDILNYKKQNKIDMFNASILDAAVKVLNIAKQTTTTTPSISIWNPGGYAGIYTRDFDYMLNGYLDYFTTSEIENIIRFFMDRIPTSGVFIYNVPDAIFLDGSIGWPPDGSRSSLDNQAFLIDIFYQYYRKTGSTALYSEFKDMLKNIMDLGMPYNPNNGLVSLPVDATVRTYGFWDTVRMTGDLFFISVLAYQAYAQLAILANANSDVSDKVYYMGKCETLKYSINSTFWTQTLVDNGTERHIEGLFKCSTGLCKDQPDVWGSCLAVYLGIPTFDRINAIANKLVNTYKNNRLDIFYKGAIRHVPISQEYQHGIHVWEAYAFYTEPTYGTYQNGGYWATPIPWVVDVIGYKDMNIASELMKECIANNVTLVSGAIEWISPSNGVGAANYCANVTMPLLGIMNNNHGAMPVPSILIDGNFQIAQRIPLGVEVVNPGSGAYPVFNIWNTNLSVSTPPTSIKHSRKSIAGELPLSDYCKRVEVVGDMTLGTTNYLVDNTIIPNGCKLYCGGQDLTVSFYARSNIANKKIGITATQIYDTAGVVSELLNGTKFTLTSEWKKYIAVLHTKNLAGKTVSADNRLSIGFIMAWSSDIGAASFGEITSEAFNTGVIDIAQVQIDIGSNALDFRPTTYYEELLNSQKQVFFDIGTTANSYANTTTVVSLSDTLFLKLNIPTSLMKDFIVSIAGTRGTDWEIRDLSNVTNATGTLSTGPINKDKPVMVFGGGAYSAGANYSILYKTTSGYICADARY